MESEALRFEEPVDWGLGVTAWLILDKHAGCQPVSFLLDDQESAPASEKKKQP
jgi:hypothetical protein